MTDQAQTHSQPSGTQEKILQLAQENPELTNAEIADRINGRVATVRDTLITYDEPAETSDKPPTEISKPVDSASFNATESAVLEYALRNPAATNAEIAAAVDTHVGLIRDIRDEHEATATLPDDGRSVSSTETDQADSSATTQEELSEIEEQILEAATNNPEYSIADIASDVDARIPLVRDTLAAHQV